MPDPAPNAHEHKARGSVWAAIWCGLAGGAVAAAVELPFLGRYGWDRDELYFLSAARRPALGYVDFPPLTAWVGWAVHAVAGNSLVGLRLTSFAAGVGTILLVTLMARELGGSWRVQLAAAVGWALLPVSLGSASIFHPTWLDLLAWAAFLYIALLVLGRPQPRLWPVLGVVGGIGLESKYTIVALFFGLFVGLLATPSRRLLATRGPWLALGIALLLLAPNLVWEAQHGWVSIHWFLNPPPSATDETRPGYVVDLILLTNAVAVPVAVAGTWRLLRDRAVRPLGATVVGTVVAYLLLGGKSYYAAPVVLFALAAGALPLDRWATRRRLAIAGAAFVLVLLYALPFAVPVLPLHTADRAGVIKARSDYQDEVGWHALAAQAGRLSRGADVILASNYGEAGALELFGRNLPPVASTDVTFRYWRPRVAGRSALLIGFDEKDASFCSTYRRVGRIAMPVDNQERGLPLARCTLDAGLPALWPALVRRDG